MRTQRFAVFAGIAALAAAATCLTAAGPALGAAPPPAPPEVGDALPLTSYSNMLVDQAHGLVFVSGGRSQNGIAVTRLTGRYVKTIDKEYGASGMVLSADGRTLYAALDSGDAIAAVDTSTLTETARYPLPAKTCPYALARTGSDVWFGYGCAGSATAGIGLLDLSANPPVARTGEQDPNSRFAVAPLLAAAGPAGPVIAAEPGVTPAPVSVFAIDGGQLHRTGYDDGGGDLTDFAVSPDGGTLFTADGSDDHVSAYAVGDLARRGAYPTGRQPVAVAVSGDGHTLATGNATPGADIAVYPVGAETPSATFTLRFDRALEPQGLAFAGPADGLLAVTRDADGTLRVLRFILPDAKYGVSGS